MIDAGVTARAALIANVAWLLSVPRLALEAFLAQHWNDEAPAQAEARLEALRLGHHRHEHADAPAPDRQRSEVAALLRAGWKPMAAIKDVARRLHKSEATIKAAFYR